MNDPQSTNRLHELFELLVNGTIAADQHDELQSLLRNNPAAQMAYFEAMDLHIGLQKLTASEPAGEKLPLPESRTDCQSVLQARGSRFRPLIGVVAAVAAVVVLIAVLPAILSDNGAMETRQAEMPETSSQLEKNAVLESVVERIEVILTQSAGAELFGEFLPPVGNALDVGHEYALIAGLIELRFPDGAKVILEAPSVIQIAGRDRLIVSAGKCSVHAPPGAEGFQVETPQAEITDLGTRFSVSVSEVGETDVQVVEGLAEVRKTLDGSTEPIRLSEHQARRFNVDAASGMQTLQFNAEKYRNNLPDRIVSYETSTTDDGFAAELQSVTVQRAGRLQTFPASDLIGVKVIHFRAGANNANVAVPFGYDGDRLEGLESDSLLHTGVLNPGGSVEPLSDDPVVAGDVELTPGMAIQFREPVVNGPGPDVVFFELQTVVNPSEGDAFHVSPLKFTDGLRSLTVRRYDIAMTSRQARLLPEFDLFFFRKSASSLEALTTGEVDRRPQTLRFRALAVGIDLSELGYPAGAMVDGLFFQDILDDGHIVDPVFIAGLPR